MRGLTECQLIQDFVFLYYITLNYDSDLDGQLTSRKTKGTHHHLWNGLFLSNLAAISDDPSRLFYILNPRPKTQKCFENEGGMRSDELLAAVE